MSEERMLLHADEADKLLASADGRAALLYLHILRSGGFSLTAASRVLRCSETEAALAADTHPYAAAAAPIHAVPFRNSLRLVCIPDSFLLLPLPGVAGRGSCRWPNL